MNRFKIRGSRSEERPTPQTGEEGYLLLGLMVAIFIIMLALGVAASKAAFAIRRDREVETVRRGNQYVRAVREFYIKNGNHYPGTIEQLEKTNNIRFLRQRYVDPLTGKDDWRMIVVGQNQTTVKGFFGEPLQGLPTAGLGSAAGLQSAGFGGTAVPTAVGANGATSGPGAGAGAGGAAPTDSSGGTSGLGSAGAFSGPGGIGGAGGFGSQSGSGFGSQSLGPIMGVGLNAKGQSLVELNEQKSYETWEFLYDPRVELLKVKQAVNQGLGTAGSGGFGQMPGTAPNGTTPGNPANPTGPGQAPGGFSTQ